MALVFGIGVFIRIMLIVVVGIVCLPSADAGSARSLFVDFENGSNDADGLSQRSAWKHAPGDPMASGVPARTRLAPGDIVRFRGGVVYRGAFIPHAAGSRDAPITFSGDSWGEQKAVVSGRNATLIDLRRCADVPSCKAVTPDDRGVLAALLAQPLPSAAQLTLDGVALNMAQSPGLADPFWTDDITTYLTVDRAAVSAAGASWRLSHPQLAQLGSSGGAMDAFLYLWGVPNLIYEARIEQYDFSSGAVTVAAPRFRPYHDRETRFALVNHPSLLRKNGDFATIDNGGMLIVKAAGGPRTASLEVGLRPVAFDASRASHLVVEGFVVEGFVGRQDEIKGGVALWLSGRSQNIAFRRNHVRDLVSRAGSGAIHATAIDGLTVEANRFERLHHGSGIRTSQSARNVMIIGNTIRRVGRTGIAIIASENVTIRDNRIHDVRGVHGNAMSAYLATRKVVIANNLVSGVTRAITFHGAGGTPNTLAINNNLVVTEGSTSVGIQSWGKGANGVTISGNMVLGPANRVAVHLDPTDKAVTVQDNMFDSFYLRGAIPGDWSVRGNVFARRPPAQFKGSATLPPDTRLEAQALDAIRATSFEDGRSLCAALASVRVSGIGPADLCRPHQRP